MSDAAAEDAGGGDCGKRYLAVASVIGDWSASSGGKDSLQIVCPMAYDQTHPSEKTRVAAMWDLFVADQIDFCC